MFYVKMTTIAIFAFGFAVLLIFQFSSVKQGGSSDPLLAEEDLLLTTKEIGDEIFRVMDGHSNLLVYGHPTSIIESPLGDMVEVILEEGECPAVIECLPGIDWFLVVSSNPEFISGPDPNDWDPSLGTFEIFDNLIAVIRFKEPVTDNEFISLCQKNIRQTFMRSEFKDRLLLENSDADSHSLWRMDRSTFIWVDAERLKNQPTSYEKSTKLDSWIKKFQKETIYDDVVIVADLAPVKRSLTRGSSWGALNLLNNATVATFEINFTKQWFLICRLDTYSPEAAFEMKKLLRIVWHRSIGQFMEQIRQAEPGPAPYFDREALKVIKSLTISQKKRKIIIGLPQPENLDEWIDRWFESYQLQPQ